MPRLDNFKQYIKLIFSYIFYYSGILKIYRNIKLKDKITILLYHDFHAPGNKQLDYSPDGMLISRERFIDQIKFLTNNYKIMSLQKYFKILDSKEELPSNICIITFDDGVRSVYTQAYPVLKKLRVPATIFLTVNFIESKEYFWEESLKKLLTLAIKLEQDGKLTIPEEIQNEISKYIYFEELRSKSEKFGFNLLTLIQTLRNERQSYIDFFINRLEQLISQSGFQEPRQFMNLDEIKEMHQNNIEFGGHSVTHKNLEYATDSELLFEINDSKKYVESNIGETVDFFAYPYGKFNLKVKDFVERAGYKGACTTILGHSARTDNPYLLKRINIHDDVSLSIPMFACRICRFLNLY